MSNTLFCILGESGSGKTTIVNELERRYYLSSIESYTTRPRRSQDERGHIFVSEKIFDEIKENNRLVAYTKFNGFRYAATQIQVELNDLYVIDVKGLQYLKEKYKGNKKIIAIYIKTNESQRIQRMFNRGDCESQVLGRLNNDEKEFIDAELVCDHIVANDNLEDCLSKISDIIQKYK